MEENKNENTQNKVKINLGNTDVQPKDFDNAKEVSSTEFDLDETTLKWKLIRLLAKIRIMEDKLPIFLTQEIEINPKTLLHKFREMEAELPLGRFSFFTQKRKIKLPTFLKQDLTQKLKIIFINSPVFLKDHWHLLFKSAKKNYERLENSKFLASSAGRQIPNSKVDIEKNTNLEFQSFNHLERYQKKVRRITFSLSSALAVVLIAAIMITYVFKPSGAEASAFIFSQSSWAGGATANTATHPTNKTSWTEYASKDATTSAAAGGVSLTQSASQAVTDNGNPFGVLTDLSPATIVAGTNPEGITISADGTSAYATNQVSNNVSMYSRNTSTGALTALSPATIATGTGPQNIVISADGTSAYVVNTGSFTGLPNNYNGSTVSMYSRNTSTGALTALSPATIATGTGPRSITISADGTSVYVTNNNSNTISMYSRDTGTGALTALSPATIATGGYPWDITISADGTSVYVMNWGDNTVSMYSRNPSTGALTALSPATIATGTTPNSITISADGASVYVANYGSKTVSMYSRNPSTGALTALSPATIATVSYSKDVTISADGTSVYVTGTSSSTVSMYSRNTSTGALTALSPATIVPGNNPSGIAISADGTSVYVANYSSNTVSMYNRNRGPGFSVGTNSSTAVSGSGASATVGLDMATIDTANFAYSGSAASYAVPAGVAKIIINANGAGGVTNTNAGGAGGSSTGTLAVTPGSTYYISVGGTGSGISGGYGGGGNGGSGNGDAGGGGGMTWFSSASTFAQGTVLLVSGGGGGGGNFSAGGTGGGSVGGNGGGTGGYYGTGGTQSAGGTGYTSGGGTNGSSGVGGIGGNASFLGKAGAGAGGGYYGGGGGGTNPNGSGGGGGGGGGSGYISSSLTSASTTQGGGAAANTNGSASIVAKAYNSSGTFTSGVIDTGAATAFTTLSYSATLNGQTLTIKARAGNSTNTADASWTDWTSAIASGGSIASLSGKQYIQYKADLSTADASVTPTLSSVTINYGGYNTSGTLTSSIYNSGNSANTITGMTWTDSGTSATETVGFQVRSASTSGGIASAAWCGPADVSAPCAGTSYFTTSTGDAIPANSPLKTGGDDQYFQYKITLASSGFATPTVTNASVQYAYNVAPAISSVTYTQNANGTVTVPYTLTETYDDLGNIAHGTAAAPIKALLFWQPDSGVTAPVLTDSQTGIITLTNTNSQPIPTSGSMLIDTELITFDSAGCTGNQRNILTRGATFDTAFPTTAASHSAGAAVFFNSSSAVQTINTFSATGTPGDNASTSGNSFVWDPRNDSSSNLNTNKLTGLLLKVVANDADATNFNTIGQSSVTAAQTLDLQLPTFTMQYYSDAGLTSSLGDNPKLKAGTYYIKISASEALASAPTISIAAEGTANDVTNAATTLVSGNDYTYTRTIASDAAAVGTTIENISITGTDSFSNVSTNVNPTDEATKAGYTDTNAPTFTMQYYSDSGLTNSLGNNPKLKAGTYYIKVSASEALASAPTISIAAEGTANDVTNAVATLVSGNDYTYTRIVANDASAVGTTIENFSVTGTDNFSNVSTNVNPTDEATKAGYTDTVVPTSPGTATLNSYLNNTGNQTVSWTQVTEASFQDYLVQRKTGIGGTFATIGTPITNIATVSYADNSALAEGTYYFQVIAEDTAGNTATSATSSVLTVDKTAPVLQSFTSSNANSDPDDPLTMYGTGDTINIQAVFNENLASGSTMTIELENTAGSQVVLNQISGSTLYGTYTVSGPHDGISDDSIDLAVRRVVSMGVSDLATNLKSSESVPAGQNLSDNKDIIVDTVPPSLQSFSATAGNYNAGDSITLTAHYNKSVKAGSNIHVKVNSDGGTATIDMTTVSTSTISGPYVVQSGDNVQNLKVASIVSQAVSDIKNNQLTDTIMPSTNISDGVLVDTTAPAITFADDVDAGPTQSDNVTINVVELNSASDQYIFSADNVCNTKNYTSANSFSSDTPLIFNTENNNNKYICTKVADTAGNISYQTSANTFNIDVTPPTGTILINRSLDSGQIQLTAADANRDITGLQMRSVTYDNDSATCDLSSATWGDFVATLDVNSESSSVKACVEYKDVAGNTSEIYTTLTPETPQNVQLDDISNGNLTPPFYGSIITWQLPTIKGQDNTLDATAPYEVLKCSTDKDSADCDPDKDNPILITDQLKNYELYSDLTAGDKYCWQVRFKDAHGNYSEDSERLCSVIGEGQIVTDSHVSIKSGSDNILVSNVTNTGATVVFATEDSVTKTPLATKGIISLYTSPTLSADSFVTATAAETDYAVTHAIKIAGLTSDTQYYLKISATDSSALSNPNRTGELAYNITNFPELTFTTNGTLASISEITESIITDAKAVVTFETNQAAKCAIEYGTETNNYSEVPFTENDYNKNHSIHLTGLIFSTTYYYNVTCVDNRGTSVSTATQTPSEYSFSTLQKQVGHVFLTDATHDDDPTVTTKTDTEAIVTFDADTTATSKLCLSTADNIDIEGCTEIMPQVTNSRIHAYHLTSLIPKTTYYIKMKLTDSELSSNTYTTGEVTFSTLDAQMDHTALSAVVHETSEPTVTMLTDTEAVVTFNAGTTSNSKMCYALVADINMESCTGTSNTEDNKLHTFHLTSLTASTPYFLKMKITDSENELDTYTTNEISFTTLETQMGTSEIIAGDMIAPAISNVKVSSITGESVTITWDTDENGNSSVGYGIESANLNNMAGDYSINLDTANYAKAHTVVVSNLIPGTKYYFTTSSTDASGNIGESSESSFTTAAPSSLSSIKVTSQSLGEATITWKTDNKLTSVVEYGLTTSYGDKKENTSYTKDHSISLSKLDQGVTYHYRVKGTDESGNLYASADNTFEPKSPPKISATNINSVTEHGAVITFTTSVPTDANVTYTDTQNSKETGSQGIRELSIDHKVKLTNLKQGTTYKVSISAKDEQGSEGKLEAQDFTTGKDENPPKIENVHTDSALAQSDKVQTIITWKTDEQSTSAIVYREGRAGEEKEYKNTDTLSTNHVIVMTSFKSGTVYNFRVKSTDAAGNESISGYFSFLTPKMKENIIQIIMNNFQEIFNWTGNVGK